jgi:hypothetical protein
MYLRIIKSIYGRILVDGMYSTYMQCSSAASVRILCMHRREIGVESAMRGGERNCLELFICHIVSRCFPREKGSFFLCHGGAFLLSFVSTTVCTYPFPYVVEYGVRESVFLFPFPFSLFPPASFRSDSHQSTCEQVHDVNLRSIATSYL